MPEVELQRADPYDLVPYESRAMRATHPEVLAIAGLLRGLDVAHPERCRYAELGCGNGGNLVPMAFHLPRARFVGVERSARQYAMACEARDRLGLDNLELIHADLLDVSDELGEVDFIVAHGVFSWVPPPVREHILALCARSLAPEGLAYVSYNAMPGWGLRGQVRRLLMAACEGTADPLEQIALARERLVVLAEGAARIDSPLGALLRHEIELARTRPDWLLLHEYLAPVNDAFDVRAFAAMAARHGLSYVTDLAGGDDAAFAGVVDRALDDPLAREDVSDFLGYRQFRATILARADRLERARGREVPDARLRELRVASQLAPAGGECSLRPDVPELFVPREHGEGVNVRSALLKAALVELAIAAPATLPLAELVERSVMRLMLAGARALDGGPERGDADALLDELIALSAVAPVELRLFDPEVAAEVSATPAVGALTRLEAERGPWVTTPRHHSVELDAVCRALVPRLDGTRGVPELVTELIAAIRSGALPIEVEGNVTADDATLREHLPAVVRERLARLADHGLLRPDRPVYATTWSTP